MRPVPAAAITLIQKYEGLHLRPYLCPAKIPTIGWGSTRYPDGRAVTLKDPPITRIQAAQIFDYDVRRKAAAVLKLINVPLTDGQYGALVSFVYNLGSGRLQASTLRRKLNQRRDYKGAAEEFDKWVWADGKKLKGLVIRREEERAMFERDMLPWLKY